MRRTAPRLIAVLALLLASCSDGDKTSGDGGGHHHDAATDGSRPSDGSTPADGAVIDDEDLDWHQANLTNYESYPDLGSDECTMFNGCMWAGMFAALDGVQSEEWVMSHNIAAVHSDDFDTYELKTLRLRQGNKSIDVVVYDMCADSDCDGCCTQNASENGLDFLIDIERYTMERFGSGGGIVEWACIDCD